jgi:hypothetical protein
MDARCNSHRMDTLVSRTRGSSREVERTTVVMRNAAIRTDSEPRGFNCNSAKVNFSLWTFTHKELVFGRIYPEHPHIFFSGLPHPEIRCNTFTANGFGTAI